MSAQITLEELRNLRALAHPMPEQETRVGEAMAGRDDSLRLRAYEVAALWYVRQELDRRDFPHINDLFDVFYRFTQRNSRAMTGSPGNMVNAFAESRDLLRHDLRDLRIEHLFDWTEE